ncbi:MAG: hypothetical protein FWG65_10485 [Turicibacter sp.]|nr:hypothetical protein [Turicibacter sp.]
MKITALLTGRGNNSLPDKNVLEVLGNPVMFYPAIAAKNSPVITDWYCSSENEKILNTAEVLGYARIVRPMEYALPTSQHEDCILHALEVMEQLGKLPDIVVVLLANNVAVKSEWITDCVEIMQADMTITAVVPVVEDLDHHPLRAKGLNADGTLCMYEKNVTGKVSTNRQDLPPCYFLAHNFWVLNVEYLRSGKTGQLPWRFMGDVIRPYIVDDTIDIHVERDLLIAKIWLEENGIMRGSE